MKQITQNTKDGTVDIEVTVIDGDLVNANTGEIVLESTQDYRVLETPEKELAVGLAVPSTFKTPTDYLKGLDEYKLAKDQQFDYVFKVCDNMYRFEGIIGSVVDLYVDLANTELIVQDVENEEAKKVIDYLNKNLNRGLQVNTTGMNAFLEQGMTHWYVFGNAFPYANWRDVKIDGKTYKLPINVIYMNPHNIEIDEDLIPLGVEDISIKVPSRLLNKELPPGTAEPDSVKELRKTYNKKKSPSNFGNVQIRLNPNNVTHIKRKPRDWEAWGIPLVLRAFSAVSSKKRLRRLDDTTTEGLVNYLTVFKLGATDSKSVYHKVSQNRLNSFAALISNPTAATTLVWTHDLAIETVGPDSQVLEFDGKYESANKDIISALGIGALLLSEGTAAEESSLVLVEILESARSAFLSYVKHIYEQVLEVNGIKAEIDVKFANIKLSDILQKLKNLVLSYYDRGLLSYETALTLGGHSFAQEVERKRKQKDVKEEGLFDVPNLPFSTNKDGQSSPSNDDGRPTDKTNDKDKNKVEDESNEPEETRSYEWSKADHDFVEMYKQALSNKVGKIKERLVSKATENKLKQLDFSLALTSGFADIVGFIDETLLGVYENGITQLNDVSAQVLIRQELNSWVYQSATKIRDSLSKELTSAASKVLKQKDQELFIPIIETSFAKHIKRIEMLSEQSYIKANVASIIDVELSKGKAGAIWLSEEGQCEVCTARNENFYKPKELFKIFPAHPGCGCKLKWVDSDATVEGKSNTPVVVDSKNPSKLK